MNLPTIIVGAIVLGAALLALRSILKNHAKGGCGCGCENCANKGYCHGKPQK